MSDFYLQKQTICASHREHSFFLLILLLAIQSSTDAVTLTGSSEYAVPGSNFTLTCVVPEEANEVKLYRRSDLKTAYGIIQISGNKCYTTVYFPPVLCSPDVCSCTALLYYGTVFQWVIQPKTEDHGSKWFCQRTNRRLASIAESPDYILNVADGPGTVALSPPDTTYIRTEGDTLPDITCTVDCRPGCTFVWTKPDNTNFTASAVLSLGQLDRSESGTYICTAWNDFGNSANILIVSVMYGPTAVVLSPSTTSFNPMEGETVPTVTCSSDCNPGCTHSWTKDGQSYTTGSDIQLTNIQRGQTGVYRCMASNGYGSQKTSSDITVNVEYAPLTVRLAPSTTSYTPAEGQTLTVTCSSDCYPVCTYSWTKDGQSYTTGSDLQLTNIQRGQTGVYICTASNKYGSRTSSYVTVIVKRAYGPRTITLSPPDTTYTRTEGDTLPDITCTAECRPGCSFVWTKPDNTNFTASAVLSLGKLDRSEHGTYRCTAGNIYGTSMLSAFVTVLYGPGNSISFKPEQDVFDKVEDQTVPDIFCSAVCEPPCTYIWSGAGTTYPNPLSLSTAARGNAGQYTCTASNSVSKETKTWNLIVSYGPGNSISFKPEQDVFDKVEDQTVPDIVCSAICEPPCTYIWSGAGTTYPNPLSLSTAARGNAGQYTCTASNSVSQETKTWNLIVSSPASGGDNTTTSGLVLGICAGVVTLLFIIGLGLFYKRNGRLPFKRSKAPNQRETESVQRQECDIVNESSMATSRGEDRSQYQQLDINAIAMSSLYSEIGSHHQGNQNIPVDDGTYESLGRRSHSNVYEECQRKRPVNA